MVCFAHGAAAFRLRDGRATSRKAAEVCFRSRCSTVRCAFSNFGDFCEGLTGVWNSERSYHYIEEQQSGSKVERSQTTFQVEKLGEDAVRKVMEANKEKSNGESSVGITVSFDTFMEDQQKFVRSYTNLVFVPEETKESGEVSGLYLRDLAYEEREPKAAIFTFSPDRQELLMKTKYTKVVSVDSITLVSPTTRVRRILNFKRPANQDDPLKDVVLAGFGMELKLPAGNNDRLVFKE